MKIITLVRHGQTFYNEEGRITGHHNPDLTALGIEQAQNLSKLFNEQALHFDHIYSSDLKRAYDTALRATNHQSEKLIERNALLRERSCGDYNGRLKTELNLLKLELANPSYKFTGGESFLCVIERVQNFIDNHINGDEKDNKSILIVSHAITTQALLVAFGEKTIEEAMKTRIPNSTPITFKIA